MLFDSAQKYLCLFSIVDMVRSLNFKLAPAIWVTLYRMPKWFLPQMDKTVDCSLNTVLAGINWVQSTTF